MNIITPHIAAVAALSSFAFVAPALADTRTPVSASGHYIWQFTQQPGPRGGPPIVRRVRLSAAPARQAACDCAMTHGPDKACVDSARNAG
jgi:hypothetical protein